MQERSKMPSEVWVSLLWAQYNKLPEALKEGFVNLAQSMAKETEVEDMDMDTETKKASVLRKV